MIKGGLFPSAKTDIKKLHANWDEIDWTSTREKKRDSQKEMALQRISEARYFHGLHYDKANEEKFLDWCKEENIDPITGLDIQKNMPCECYKNEFQVCDECIYCHDTKKRYVINKEAAHPESRFVEVECERCAPKEPLPEFIPGYSFGISL